jgi:hypothetical protein
MQAAVVPAVSSSRQVKDVPQPQPLRLHDEPGKERRCASFSVKTSGFQIGEQNSASTSCDHHVDQAVDVPL